MFIDLLILLYINIHIVYLYHINALYQNLQSNYSLLDLDLDDL